MFFFEIIFLQWNGCKFSTCINIIQFNSIALPKIKLQKMWMKNCHQNQTSCIVNLKY
jgi:hypothetical protein